MKKIWVLLALGFICTGCATTEPVIRDVARKENRPFHYYYEKSAWSAGPKLYIDVEQNSGINLARITPKIYRGEIYLEQFRISSGGGGIRTFEIDLSKYKLPPDWEEHVYWIAESSNEYPLFGGGLPQHTDRIKINVEKRDPHNLAAYPPTSDELEHAFRQFDSNAKRKYIVRRFEIEGLWEALHIAAFQVNYRTTLGRTQGIGLYHAGKFIYEVFGSYGIDSGVVVNGEFYFTYSVGSGVMNSILVKIRNVNGKLEYADSGGALYLNDFRDGFYVARGSDGKVHVCSEGYMGFNQPPKGKDLGTLAETPDHELQLIGLDGKVLEPSMKYDRKRQPYDWFWREKKYK